MGVLKVGWGRASGNHQDVANNMSQFNGVSDMVPSCQLCGSVALCGEGSERSNGLNQHLLSGRKLSPALALVLDSSVPPHMSLKPSNLLPPHWSSKGVSPNKSVWGPFKSNCLGFQKFLSSTTSILTGFYSQKLWRIIFLALEPWAGGPGVGLYPLLLR